MDNLLLPKIMIIDDHAGYRQSLKELIQEFDIEVICEASNGLEALQLLLIYKPSVIILDIEMEEMNGYEFLPIVKEKYPLIKIIINTQYPGYIYDKEFRARGADMVMLKGVVIEQMVANIHTLQVKESTSKPEIKLNFDPSKRTFLNEVSLTEREKEVFLLICEGRTTKEIASQLYLSPRTVEAHRLKIYKKTKTSSLAELIIYAIQHGFIKIYS